MKIIFLSDFCRRTGTIDICVPRAAALGGLVLGGLVAVSAYTGFKLGERHGEDLAADASATEVYRMLQSEQQAIAEAKAEQRAHLDALALKIAELQAHMIRLDALGERLVSVGKLDTEEFDFSSAPPLGGVDDALGGESQSVRDLSEQMARIGSLLADRAKKLDQLEQVLMNRDVMAEVTPSGRPLKKGWMSSSFGKRTDPFNGKKSYHRGVDFAGKRGTEVVAVASGVVLRSKRVPGYGNVVEIKHAGGYSTLYGHNQENLVTEGDVVNKGQTIALLGSTGRSSGPHVHFEVHRDGKIVNPLRFVRSR